MWTLFAELLQLEGGGGGGGGDGANGFIPHLNLECVIDMCQLATRCIVSSPVTFCLVHPVVLLKKP